MISLFSPIFAIIFIAYSFFTNSYGWMLLIGIIILIIISGFIDEGNKLYSGNLPVSKGRAIHETSFYRAYHTTGIIIGILLFLDLFYVAYMLIFS